MSHIHKLKAITIVLLVISWWWLPTGPTDLWIIPFIVALIGIQGYVIVSLILIVLLYLSIPGKTIKDKLSTIFKYK
jgi:hypothetical protein